MPRLVAIHDTFYLGENDRKIAVEKGGSVETDDARHIKMMGHDFIEAEIEGRLNYLDIDDWREVLVSN